MACYATKLLANEEGFGLCAFYDVLDHFRPLVCTVSTLITFSSNPRNFENNPNSKKINIPKKITESPKF